MMTATLRGSAIALSFIAILFATPAHAAKCGNTSKGFNSWLAAFKKEAVRKGISKRTVSRSLDGVKYHRKVVSLDRNQKSFKLSFAQFYKRRVSNALIAKGRRMMKRHARTLSRIEKKYGVPPAVIVAIWGLETSYGGFIGNMSVMRSLATLAYDCRRSAFFTNELYSALKIVQRGDMSPRQMRGAWAGELGQTQFLASSYIKYAVDFDGNGRRDLIRSVPDALGSTGNYLRAYGWRRGGSWKPGTANYNVLRGWNKSSVYRKTIATMAAKLAGK